MTLTEEGPALRITYHDEDGVTQSERFDFSSAGQRAAFNRAFGRRIAQGRSPLELESPDQACQLRGHLPTPDFVVFRRIGKKRAAPLRIAARLFDYQGRYRVADR
jgi:DNA repair protein RadD